MDLKKFKRITIGKFCYEDFFKKSLDYYVLKNNVKYMILQHKDKAHCDKKYLERGLSVVDKYPNVKMDLYVSCCHYHCIIWYSGCYSNQRLFKAMSKYKKII